MFGFFVASPGLVLAAEPARPAVELPVVDVAGAPVPLENKIVGTYGQPEWSARRPFPGLSVYVQPVGQFELETAFTAETRADAETRQEWTQEIEIGLGHRVQLALENAAGDYRESDPAARSWREESLTLGLRYALADWGKLPLNPAIGAGWKLDSGATDAALWHLVLAEEITPRWHWAGSLEGVHRTGADRRANLEVGSALTFSVTDETLNVGVQARWRDESKDGAPSLRFLQIGPCVQYRPWDEFHLDLVGYWSDGTRDAPREEVTLSIGYEFGEGADDHDGDRHGPGGKFDR